MNSSEHIIVFIKEPTLTDEEAFLVAARSSQKLHHPWVISPQTPEEFKDYVQKYQKDNQKSCLVLDSEKKIVGVFNLSEIVRGGFQSAYLGFYAMVDYAG